MFYKRGKKRKGYKEPVVMLVNFNLFRHKQCQLPDNINDNIRFFVQCTSFRAQKLTVGKAPCQSMFYKSMFYKSTFYKSMFYKSTIYKSMFYKSTFYKSMFYKSSPCFTNPIQSLFYNIRPRSRCVSRHAIPTALRDGKVKTSLLNKYNCVVSG